MKFDIDCFTPEGLLKTTLATMAASGLTGQVALANGGTAADNSSQAANKVFASPTSGGAGAMSIRSLVAADIPSLPASQIGSGTLALAHGGGNADFSASGGANQYVKQSSSGGNFSVGLAGVDLLLSRGSLSGASQAINSFSQAFNLLLLVLELRSAVVSTSDTGQVQLGDASLDSTAGNYLTYRMVHSGAGPTQTSVENLGATAQVRFSVPGASAPSNYTSFTLIWINNYSTSSRLKQIRIENGYAIGTSTGNVAEEVATGYWLNTSKALTQFSISCLGGNLASPSSYQLWGYGVP